MVLVTGLFQSQFKLGYTSKILHSIASTLYDLAKTGNCDCTQTSITEKGSGVHVKSESSSAFGNLNLSDVRPCRQPQGPRSTFPFQACHRIVSELLFPSNFRFVRSFT